jgi:3-phenylpropionate/trans-cinnamate dioxygenase ferredoxin reductase subunit
MVIVGAGESGARAALALRAAGHAGAITLIGDEPHAPYERPPLSKAIMTAEADPENSAVVLSHARATEQGIDFIHSTRAVAIDRAARTVALADGRRVPYARLLLATGARPRRLSLPGAEHALYLRTFDDALHLRTHLRPGARLVLIGGGFIGLEIAASAIARGCQVTLLEMAPRILMRGVPEPIARAVAERHRQAGVDLRTGVAIAALRRGAVKMADGTEILCDGVIAGIGALPETALAEACGLAIDNGVAVDETLRTSDPDIFASGDCCSFPAPLFGRRLRLEAWRNAGAQGELAARNMLRAEEAYRAVPWFWSDQYEQTLQVAGLPDAGTTLIERPVSGGLLFFHLNAAGRLVAASAVGPLAIAKDIRVAEMLIAKQATPDPAALADPAIKLRGLAA